MNILTSYSWLKEYLKTDLSPEDFASRVSLSGPSIERIYPQGENLEKIVVGKIVNISKHPNADKLKIVETDIGGKHVKIVCGGSNLREGMKVVVALPGARVRWHGEGELVTLEETKIRGEASYGMICASSEVGLELQFPLKVETEILDLGNLDVKPGTPLKKALNLEMPIFDIEITTNRPDSMCIVGIAREAGTILKEEFNPPLINIVKGGKDESVLKVKNSATDLCHRYQAVVIEGVHVKESPLWLKQKLASVGKRSINNIVDITNLVLWEMAQPLHAFDHDKIQGKKIIIRNAKQGEVIKALDGIEYKLKDNMLVIADAKNLCAIAGVMGGEESGVNDKTTTIVLESATFDPVSVRKTSRELNLRSESSALFEKGLSTESTSIALMRAIGLIKELAGGVVKSPIYDERSKQYKPKEVSVSTDKVRSVMGIDLEDKEMIDILERLGFEVRLKGGNIITKPPYWREGDIEIAEDLIEEIARIYGYHRIPSVLPATQLPDEMPDKTFYWQDRIRDFSVGAGFFEVYPYSFISLEMLENMGYKKEDAVAISNPLTEDLAFMRPSLLPGLLKIVKDNENNFPEAKLFELSRVYIKKSGDLPDELLRYAGMIYGKDNDGKLFYKTKGCVEELLNRFGIVDYELKIIKDKKFHPARSLSVFVNNEHLGDFGEIHPAVAKRNQVNSRVGFFDIDFAILTKYARSHKTFISLPEYPGVKRDLSFIVDEKIEFEAIKEVIYSVDALISDVEVFDVYAGKGVPEKKKSIALHILLRSSHKTLEAKEADEIWQNIMEALTKKLKVEFRG